MLKLAPADLEKAAQNIAKQFAKMRKGLDDFTKQLSADLGECHKILGVEEAKQMGDGEPKPAGAVPAGATKPDYSFKTVELKDGKLMKIYHEQGDESKVVKTEIIDPATQPITQGEVEKRVADGIEQGLQTILKAMLGEEEAEQVLKAAKKPAAGSASDSASGSASGSASDSASGSASGEASEDKPAKKAAAGVGDRTNMPTVVAGGGPAIKVVTKLEDGIAVNRMTKGNTEAETTVDADTVRKALQNGDTAAALKLMKGAVPTDVPGTVAEAFGKLAQA